MNGAPLTVSQVNFFVKSLLEGDNRLNDILVTGEISNFTDHYRSGHLYFSLKDSKSALKAVMFASSARSLKFRPADGMRVIVRGRVSVYEAAGQYQLYVQDMQPDGLGALSLAFEQLKERLAAEGLFDQEHKRPLPTYPRRIGVITSPTGAAVRDILQITARRWPVAEIVFCPALVQGEGAPAQLTAAIREMNRKSACDVLVLGRGGGSLEDLWAFNDEGLARAVYRSAIPVVSAVGHETDFTICDFAADLRAPTPSAAAELCTPDLREERRRLQSYNRYFREAAQKLVDSLRQQVDLAVEDSALGQPERFLAPWQEEIGRLFGRAVAFMGENVEDKKQKLALASGSLDALSPLKVLSRGYAVVTDRTGGAVREADKLAIGDTVTLRFHQGRAKAQIVEREERKNEGKGEI